GKSTVSKYLITRGYQVFDSDHVVRELYQDETFSKMIARKFNAIDQNGTLDKKVLRNSIFNDKKKRKKLEMILHPYVFDKMDIFKNSTFDHLIFLDIPLLFETGYDAYDQ